MFLSLGFIDLFSVSSRIPCLLEDALATRVKPKALGLDEFDQTYRDVDLILDTAELLDLPSSFYNARILQAHGKGGFFMAFRRHQWNSALSFRLAKRCGNSSILKISRPRWVFEAVWLSLGERS